MCALNSGSDLGRLQLKLKNVKVFAFLVMVMHVYKRFKHFISGQLSGYDVWTTFDYHSTAKC